MAAYVSPAIEQIADYADATRGWFYGPLRDFIGEDASSSDRAGVEDELREIAMPFEDV